MSLVDNYEKLFVEKILSIYSKYRTSTRPSSATINSQQHSSNSAMFFEPDANR